MTENGQANGYASRDQLLAPSKRRFKDVKLPISGLKLRIRSLMENEVEAFIAEGVGRQGAFNKEKTVSAHRRIIIKCVVDSDGQPMLSHADLDALNEWDSADIHHLARECESHCGLVQGEVAEKN